MQIYHEYPVTCITALIIIVVLLIIVFILAIKVRENDIIINEISEDLKRVVMNDYDEDDDEDYDEDDEDDDDEFMEYHKPKMNPIDRLNYTKSLFNFIDMLVDTELIYFKKNELYLKDGDGNKSHLKNTDFDVVIETISKNVFESLKPEIYSMDDNILTEKCIMEYIQKRTVMTYLTYIELKLSEVSE